MAIKTRMISKISFRVNGWILSTDYLCACSVRLGFDILGLTNGSGFLNANKRLVVTLLSPTIVSPEFFPCLFTVLSEGVHYCSLKMLKLLSYRRVEHWTLHKLHSITNFYKKNMCLCAL